MSLGFKRLTTQAYRQQHCIKGTVILVIQAQNERVIVHVKIRKLWCPVRLQSEQKTSESTRLDRTHMKSTFIENSSY